MIISIVPPTDVEPISIGCTYNDDCPDHAACRNSACINPCAAENPCAPSAICTVVKHKPLCSCPDGYIGTPEIDCRLRKQRKVKKCGIFKKIWIFNIFIIVPIKAFKIMKVSKKGRGEY